jgi:hypothetical protein
MNRALVCLHDRVVEIRCPSDSMADIKLVFQECLTVGMQPHSSIVIDEINGGFSISVDGITSAVYVRQSDLQAFIMDAVVYGLIKGLASAVVLHAGAVMFNNKAALVVGPTGSGKSSLVAWLIARGFGYLSDEITLLFGGEPTVQGFPRALVLKRGSVEKLLAMPYFRDVDSIAAGQSVMLRPQSRHDAAANLHPCNLIVFPEYVEGAELQIEPVGAAQIALRLVENNVNARNLPDGGFATLVHMARHAPAFALRYGDFDQLNDRVDVLMRTLLDRVSDSSDGRHLLSLLAPRRSATAGVETPTVAKYDIPAPTPRREPRKLTIGMATYDDYDGVYFSLQAIRLYHPEILNEVDFLLVDNHPDGPCSADLKALERSIPNFRYVPFFTYSGTAVRDHLFAEADGDFVLCMDCHVFVVPGALRLFVQHIGKQPDTLDLMQGPLLYDDLSTISTHFHPAWRAGMYGYWETDERGADAAGPPFDIPMQGLGLFGCRRAAWPGLNPAFRGFGGEEGYLHAKFRRNGGRTLCLPFLRWMHRFARPLGTRYPNRWDDRIRNYLIGFRELNLPTADLEQHYREFLGASGVSMLETIYRELDDEGFAGSSAIDRNSSPATHPF